MNPDEMVHIQIENLPAANMHYVQRTWPPQLVGQPLLPPDTGLLITDVDYISLAPEAVWSVTAVDATDPKVSRPVLWADGNSPAPQQTCVGMWRSTVGAYVPPGHTLTVSQGQAVIRGYWYGQPGLAPNDNIPAPDLRLPAGRAETTSRPLRNVRQLK